MEDSKITVFFPMQDVKTYVDRGATVSSACFQAGLDLDYVCGGKGTCKKCTVDIEKRGRRSKVLACQEKIFEDVQVYLTDRHLETHANILTDSDLSDTEYDPVIEKRYFEKKTLPLCSGAWEQIDMGKAVGRPSLGVLSKLAAFGADRKTDGYTFTYWRDSVIDIEVGNNMYEAYGLAIDIGTTTVAAYLYDLITGRNIGIYSDLNAQVSEGGDVLTRIMASTGSIEGPRGLQRKIVSTINGLIDRAVDEHDLSSDNIYNLALCGNSAMQHLFLGLEPGNLGKVPFTSVTLGDVIATAKDLGIGINPEGIVHFLPLIGGFVGADTTAVLLSILDRDDKMRLIIDIGTNGEMVLGHKGKLLATSTAAGPALEGAGITFGMRGTRGAVERVNLSDGTVKMKVIMGGKPLGVCGSGLIDAIAEMLKVGILDYSGRLLSREAFLEIADSKYVGFAENLERIDNQNVFVLANGADTAEGNKIYICQKDVRAVQLAKGAIFTGSKLLMEEYGIEGEDIDEILIAGAFGNYIDAKKGQYIGLLPSFEGVPIRSMGNAAGAGVQRFLLSKDIQDSALPLTRGIRHVELASNAKFHEEFIGHLNFPRVATS